MNRFSLCAFVLLLSNCFAGESPLQGADAPAIEHRLAIPDAAKIADTKKILLELFADDYAKAKVPAQKTALANKLLEQGTQTNDDPVAKYTCLLESIRLASEAGELSVADNAILHLAEFFAVNADALRRKALMDSMATAKDAEAQRALAALKTLDTNSTDAAANLALGRYLCFSREMWDAGLPFLRAGGDEKLKTIAEAEIKKPQDALSAVDVADAWWDVAGKEQEPRKGAILRRAGLHYRAAIPTLSGLTKVKAEKRVAEVPSGTSTAAAKPGNDPARLPPSVAAPGQLPRGYFVGMIGRYFEGKRELEYVFLKIPNGKNVQSKEVRDGMMPAPDGGWLRFEATGSISIPEDGTYFVEAGNASTVTIGKDKYDLDNYHKRNGSEVKLRKGFYPITFNVGNNGGQLQNSFLRVVDTKTQTELPIIISKNEVIALMSKDVAGKKRKDLSGWIEENKTKLSER